MKVACCVYVQQCVLMTAMVYFVIFTFISHAVLYTCIFLYTFNAFRQEFHFFITCITQFTICFHHSKFPTAVTVTTSQKKAYTSWKYVFVLPYRFCRLVGQPRIISEMQNVTVTKRNKSLSSLLAVTDKILRRTKL